MPGYPGSFFKRRYRIHRKNKFRNTNVIKRIRKLERGQSGRELKYHDVALSTSVTTGNSVQALTLVAQGNTSLTREGLKIAIHSLRFRGYLYPHASQTDATLFEYALVIDTKNAGAAITWADVFENDSTNEWKEHDEGSRFIILNHRMMDLSLENKTQQKIRIIKYFKRFKKPLKVEFKGTSASQGDASTNCMFFMQKASVASNGVVSNMNFRLRFTD